MPIFSLKSDCNRALVFLLCQFVFSPGLHAAMPEPDYAETLFDRTVAAVQKSSQDDRVDFATIALRELVETYMAEADLARKEGSENNNNRKLVGWADSVDRFAAQMLIVLEDAGTGYPVDLSKTASGAVGLTVADRMIVLAHPRADQQRAYERRVLAEFCTSKNCTELTLDNDEQDPSLFPIVSARPLWSFTKDGPICISNEDEIEIQFLARHNMSAIRTQCLQLLSELSALRYEISWNIRRGVSVHWDKVALLTTPEKPEHLVVLNDTGDSTLLVLPLLYANPAILENFGRWLSSKTNNRQSNKLQIEAKNIVWTVSR